MVSIFLLVYWLTLSNVIKYGHFWFGLVNEGLVTGLLVMGPQILLLTTIMGGIFHGEKEFVQVGDNTNGKGKGIQYP